MLLSALSFLVVAQSSSEVPEGLMNNPVYHPLDICPSAIYSKYSMYAVQNANLIIKFSVPSVSLTASYSRNSLFRNEPEGSVSYQKELATSVQNQMCV